MARGDQAEMRQLLRDAMVLYPEGFSVQRVREVFPTLEAELEPMLILADEASGEPPVE